MSEYTREEILKLIEENGGPEGLDVSGRDLSGANLENMDLRGVVLGHYSPGLPRTNLQGARLVGVNLQGAKALRVDFRGATLYLANLREADLRWSDFTDTNLYAADLRGANLYRAKLYSADLWKANLEGADLYMALFDDRSHLSRQSIGESVLQEHSKQYCVFVERFIVPDSRHETKTHMADRYLKAKEVYLRLKNVFLANARYDDASWAHFKEQEMDKLASAPWRARANYGEAFSGDVIATFWQWLRFYLKHTAKWLLSWAADLSCGYGERPLRVVIWSVVILLVFPVLYRWSGGVVSKSGTMTWLDYFNYSLGAFTTIGFSQFEAATPVVQTLSSLEALLGISVLALLMFALGNRMSR